jgi:hypothetical protein
MFKVRVGVDKKLHIFDTRDEAFNWVRDNVSGGNVFSLLAYDRGGNLESLDRYTFTGRRMVMENITR